MTDIATLKSVRACFCRPSAGVRPRDVAASCWLPSSKSGCKESDDFCIFDALHTSCD